MSEHVDLKTSNLTQRLTKLTPLELLHFMHKQVIELQIERIETTHADLFERKDTKPVISFFFSKIYSPDLSSKRFRDETLNRVFYAMPDYLSENAVRRMKGILELNDLTDKIDILIANKLIELRQPDLSYELTLEHYEDALSRMDLYKSRLKQVNYIIDTMEFFYQLSRRPFLHFLFKPARMMARVMDAESLMAIVEEGYDAAKPLKEFDHLAHTLRHREVDYLKKIWPNKKPSPKTNY